MGLVPACGAQQGRRHLGAELLDRLVDGGRPHHLHQRLGLGRWPELAGGRPDDTTDAWLFPFHGKEKILIGMRVQPHGDIIVEDHAEVRLNLSTLEGGVLVTGQTLPVEKFLKGRGGIWNASRRGWFFDGYDKVVLRKRLWKCRVVEAIDDIGED